MLAGALGNAADYPDVRAARLCADCSADLHQATALLELRLAGFDDGLALAISRASLAASNPCSLTGAEPGQLRDSTLLVTIAWEEGAGAWERRSRRASTSPFGTPTRRATTRTRR